MTKNPITPHGGLCLATKTNYYEIVFFPYEVRVYLYDAKLQPLAAAALHAQISPQVSEGENAKIPLLHVSPGGAEQDYVAVDYDLTRVPDDTPILVEFVDLPDRNFPTASFTPVFKQEPAAIRGPGVADGRRPRRRRPAAGLPGQRDGPGRQQHDRQGAYHQYPLYLSSEKCIDEVRGEPRRFLPQPPGTPGPGRPVVQYPVHPPGQSPVQYPVQPPGQSPVQYPVQPAAAQFPQGPARRPSRVCRPCRTPPLYRVRPRYRRTSAARAGLHQPLRAAFTVCRPSPARLGQLHARVCFRAAILCAMSRP